MFELRLDPTKSYYTTRLQFPATIDNKPAARNRAIMSMMKSKWQMKFASEEYPQGTLKGHGKEWREFQDRLVLDGTTIKSSDINLMEFFDGFTEYPLKTRAPRKPGEDGDSVEPVEPATKKVKTEIDAPVIRILQTDKIGAGDALEAQDVNIILNAAQDKCMDPATQKHLFQRHRRDFYDKVRRMLRPLTTECSLAVSH